jgi:hypothetical protein
MAGPETEILMQRRTPAEMLKADLADCGDPVLCARYPFSDIL